MNPYQSPVSGGEVAVTPVAGLKKLRPLALWSVWLYGIAMAAEAADHAWRALVPLPAGWPGTVGMTASDAVKTFSPLEFSAHDTYQVETSFEPLDLLMMVTGLASAVLYLVWKYRAAANACLLDSRVMAVSPAMAVGSYFIPFLCFVAPCRAMAGIARASLGHTGGVGLWWACHLGSLTLGLWMAWSEWNAADWTSPASIRPLPVEYFYLLVSIVTFLVSVRLVLRITGAQEERRYYVGASGDGETFREPGLQ